MLVVRFGFRQRQAALEHAGAFVQIAARCFEPPQMAEGFHFRLTVAELLGNAEGLLIPRMRLGVANALFLALAGAHQGAHRLR